MATIPKENALGFIHQFDGIMKNIKANEGPRYEALFLQTTLGSKGVLYTYLPLYVFFIAALISSLANIIP